MCSILASPQQIPPVILGKSVFLYYHGFQYCFTLETIFRERPSAFQGDHELNFAEDKESFGSVQKVALTDPAFAEHFRMVKDSWLLGHYLSSLMNRNPGGVSLYTRRERTRLSLCCMVLQQPSRCCSWPSNNTT